MNKNIKLERKNGVITILLNDKPISNFEITQNRINGKELFDALEISIDDKFELEPLTVDKDSKDIEDIVLINTYEFMSKVVERVNSKLLEISIFS